MTLKTKKHVLNLGTKVTSRPNLKNIARIKGFLSYKDFEKLEHTFIFNGLDYYSGVYVGAD